MNEKVGTKERWIDYLKRHKRFGIIINGIIALNLAFGFDARFIFINLF